MVHRTLTVLERDAANPYDPNAVNVCRTEGLQLGYLSREVAQDVARSMDSGHLAAGVVTEVTGGTRDEPTVGLNVIVLLAGPTVSEEAVTYVSLLDMPSDTPEGKSGCLSAMLLLLVALGTMGLGVSWLLSR